MHPLGVRRTVARFGEACRHARDVAGGVGPDHRLGRRTRAGPFALQPSVPGAAHGAGDLADSGRHIVARRFRGDLPADVTALETRPCTGPAA